MVSTTTTTTATAWSPDVQGFAPEEVLPDALILQTATIAGRVEGDAPAVRVPWVSDSGVVGFVAEGAEIPESAPTLAETLVYTDKVAQLNRLSREQLAQPGASLLIVSAMSRAVIGHADQAYLGSLASPTGLLNVAGIGNGGTVTADLDPVADAITAIEAAGGLPSHIIAAPDAWGFLAKIKNATGSAAPLLGAGTEAAERRVLGLPVLTSAQAPAGTILVVDSRSILAAVGEVQLATSEDVYFASDSVGVRVTWRIGWKAMRPERIVKLTTTV